VLIRERKIKTEKREKRKEKRNKKEEERGSSPLLTHGPRGRRLGGAGRRGWRWAASQEGGRDGRDVV